MAAAIAAPQYQQVAYKHSEERKQYEPVRQYSEERRSKQYEQEQRYEERRSDQYEKAAPQEYGQAPYTQEAPKVSAEQWDRLNPIKAGESYELDQLRKEWARFLP